MDCFVASLLAMTGNRIQRISCSPRHRTFSTTPRRSPPATAAGRARPATDYWAFVGPFGGVTAATILRALIDHPQRAGDPLALTVNFCAPIAEGAFDLDVRLVKANRSSQHWCVEMTQGGGEVATLATAVFAERRPVLVAPASDVSGRQCRSSRRCPFRISPLPWRQAV